MRVQVLEAKVRSLEGEVEYLKNPFRNLMDIMCAQDFQVLPTVAMQDGASLNAEQREEESQAPGPTTRH